MLYQTKQNFWFAKNYNNVNAMYEFFPNENNSIQTLSELRIFKLNKNFVWKAYNAKLLICSMDYCIVFII